MGEWRYSSTILDLCSRCRWVVSFTPLPPYPTAIGPPVITKQEAGWALEPVWMLWRRDNCFTCRESIPCSLETVTDLQWLLYVWWLWNHFYSTGSLSSSQKLALSSPTGWSRSRTQDTEFNLVFFCLLSSSCWISWKRFLLFLIARTLGRPHIQGLKLIWLCVVSWVDNPTELGRGDTL
jgi:hypothetical protein